MNPSVYSLPFKSSQAKLRVRMKQMGLNRFRTDFEYSTTYTGAQSIGEQSKTYRLIVLTQPFSFPDPWYTANFSCFDAVLLRMGALSERLPEICIECGGERVEKTFESRPIELSRQLKNKTVCITGVSEI